MEMRRLC